MRACDRSSAWRYMSGSNQERVLVLQPGGYIESPVGKSGPPELVCYGFLLSFGVSSEIRGGEYGVATRRPCLQLLLCMYLEKPDLRTRLLRFLLWFWCLLGDPVENAECSWHREVSLNTAMRSKWAYFCLDGCRYKQCINLDMVSDEVN